MTLIERDSLDRCENKLYDLARAFEAIGLKEMEDELRYQANVIWEVASHYPREKCAT